MCSFWDVTFLKGNCAPDEEALLDRWDGRVLKATSGLTAVLHYLRPRAHPTILWMTLGLCTALLMWQTRGVCALFSALLCGLGRSQDVARQ